MSRYFTSSPCVYARNWANDQNLVESTKIERQIVASKKVHRKKEKKENKKEKKHRNEKFIAQLYYPTKQVSEEPEQLEKSCLTDEHEQQISLGYLSDGSQNSNKRRRETSPAIESQIRAKPVAGIPLRIRFVFKKPKEVVVPQENHVCSTSGTDRLNETSTSVSGSKICNSDENLLSTSIESDKSAIPSESKKRKKHKTSKASLYNTLFDEWVPPRCLSLKEDENNNDDWAFSTKRQENASSMKDSIKNDEDAIMDLQTSKDSSIYPRARFLSEVGIFSLPYTVPF